MSRSLGIFGQACYGWRKEHGGLRTCQAQRLKAIEQEKVGGWGNADWGWGEVPEEVDSQIARMPCVSLILRGDAVGDSTNKATQFRSVRTTCACRSNSLRLMCLLVDRCMRHSSLPTGNLKDRQRSLGPSALGYDTLS